MCWNEAGTTPCAELGKENFLFPEKSSYIRGLVTERGRQPQAPYHCQIPLLDPGAQVRMFPGPGVLLPDPELPFGPAPTPHPSQGLCQHPLNIPRLPRGRALLLPPPGQGLPTGGSPPPR